MVFEYISCPTRHRIPNVLLSGFTPKYPTPLHIAGVVINPRVSFPSLLHLRIPIGISSASSYTTRIRYDIDREEPTDRVCTATKGAIIIKFPCLLFSSIPGHQRSNAFSLFTHPYSTARLRQRPKPLLFLPAPLRGRVQWLCVVINPWRNLLIFSCLVSTRYRSSEDAPLLAFPTYPRYTQGGIP
jgi:hypothetical protein